MRSTGVNVRKEFVSPDLNAAVNITQCVALETRPAEPTRANFAGHPLPLDVYKQKLKPIAVGRSKRDGRRLRMVFHLPYTVVGHFLFHEHLCILGNNCIREVIVACFRLW